MQNGIILTLQKIEVTQILDALYQRLETWKYTADYLQTGRVNENHCIEECSNVMEAQRIAQYYNEIIQSIERQLCDSKLNAN